MNQEFKDELRSIIREEISGLESRVDEIDKKSDYYFNQLGRVFAKHYGETFEPYHEKAKEKLRLAK